MIQACLQLVPDVADRGYDHLRLILYGASPIAETTLRRAMDVFGCDFVQAFGMTETSGALTVLTPADHRMALSGRTEILRSAGRTLPGTRLRIVDPSGADSPPDAIGEVVASGPQLMRGYWNLPDATAEALKDGWMHTGDGGRLDADGYLYIEDRLKDMIVAGGENVYPREIENVLFEHPAIADCAVIGVPSDRWGEEVKAVVALSQGADLVESELIEFCRGRLAGFKIPRSVDVLGEIPRNASGKGAEADRSEIPTGPDGPGTCPDARSGSAERPVPERRRSGQVERFAFPGGPLTLDTVHALYDELFCGACERAEPLVLDGDGQILIHR